MIILSIESSCDDTSVALVKATRGKFEILKELTASQIEIHKKYGGVVPEIAGRMHAEKILPLIEEVLSSSFQEEVASEARRRSCRSCGSHSPGLSGHPLSGRGGQTKPFGSAQSKPDVICVTSGPGLITGLLVGVEAAKTLSYLWNVSLVGVNHIEGHVHSVEIKEKRNKEKGINKDNCLTPYSLLLTPSIKYPALALIASGGHTELILIKKQGQYKKIGATLDDAAGECFDKVAKMLGFAYPGGPKISLHAQNGNSQAIKFPRPMLKENNFNFSFAGLKTSALYWLRDNALSSSFQEEVYRAEARDRGVAEALPNNGNSPRLRRPPLGKRGTTLNDFCASFEQAIIDVLVGKTLKAAEKYKPKTIILGGGVAANKKLRETLSDEIKNITPYSLLLTPSLKYCMDNAAMIAIAGYYKAKNKKFTKWNKLMADPNWEIIS